MSARASSKRLSAGFSSINQVYVEGFQIHICINLSTETLISGEKNKRSLQFKAMIGVMSNGFECFMTSSMPCSSANSNLDLQIKVLLKSCAKQLLLDTRHHHEEVTRIDGESLRARINSVVELSGLANYRA
jgi:hypothetical protein